MKEKEEEGRIMGRDDSEGAMGGMYNWIILLPVLLYTFFLSPFLKDFSLLFNYLKSKDWSHLR